MGRSERYRKIVFLRQPAIIITKSGESKGMCNVSTFKTEWWSNSILRLPEFKI